MLGSFSGHCEASRKFVYSSNLNILISPPPRRAQLTANTAMGRGSFTVSAAGSRVSRGRSLARLSLAADVQRFLAQPRPRSWLNALAEHPALREGTQMLKMQNVSC